METKEKVGIRNAIIASFIITTELIGPISFKVMGINVTLLNILWAIFIGMAVSPHLLGRVIPALKKFIRDNEINVSPYLLSLTLYPLGIMFGINAGPKVEKLKRK
ncbi:DUF3100 domain-containing protein [Clostridioides sp. ZZV15-6383]|uniref:DUF3100 domain-containing protein n=1 Tax=unclassified Clostridioides TaxID=2635829 RepID=UPI0027E482BA